MAKRPAPKAAPSRLHDASVRIQAATLEKAKLAAALAGESLSAYITRVVGEAAARDVAAGARRLLSDQ